MYTVHDVVLKFESYIAQPYWPEVEQVINIQKKSGMNFARSDDKRDKTLKAYLDKEGIAYSEYEELVALSKRPWYRIDPNNPDTEIIIPRHQFSGMLVESTKRSPSSVIKTDLADNLRTLLRITDFGTGKTTADDKWGRYVKHPDTNQRRYQEDPVIQQFDARGQMTFDVQQISPKTVETLLTWGLSNIGVGGARKMGYGRGKLLSIKPSDETVDSPMDAPTAVPIAA